MKDFESIADISIKYNIWILSDEIYSRIIYEGEFASIYSLEGMKDRTIILDGFSKTYAMTGWRIGYGVMPKDIALKIAQLETNCESCTAAFTQIAAIEAYLGPQDTIAKMVAEFRTRRDLMVSLLNDIDWISCLTPKGSFYVFPNVTKACNRIGFMSSRELQEYLLYEADVTVLPRTAFGAKNTCEDQEYIRLSYATSRENVVYGLKRIKDAI